MYRASPLKVIFYQTETGNEPVREWLRSLSKEDRKIIGEDIKTAQLGWPIGMPIAKSLGKGIWEIRSNLSRRISRVLFAFREDRLVLLHGFIKKANKITQQDLDLARKRLKDLGG